MLVDPCGVYLRAPGGGVCSRLPRRGLPAAGLSQRCHIVHLPVRLPLLHHPRTNWASGRLQALQGHTHSSIAPEEDVGVAIRQLLQSFGRTPGAAEECLEHLLKSNWYNTAGDVANMTQEEVRALRVPIKLWAAIKENLTADSTAAAAPNTAVAAQGPWQQQQLVKDKVEGADSEPTNVSTLQRLPWERRGPVHVRKVALQSSDAYGLKEEDMTPALRSEFDALKRFCTGRFFGQKVEPIKEVTYTTVTYAHLRRMLGWQVLAKGVPKEQLSLRGLLPSTEREAVSQLLEYQHFREQRGCTVRSSELPIKACIHLARFLYHDVSQPPPPGASRRSHPPYHDVPVIQELQALLRVANRAVAKAPLVADESKKWLEWEEFLQVVATLRAEAAELMQAAEMSMAVRVGGQPEEDRCNSRGLTSSSSSSMVVAATSSSSPATPSFRRRGTRAAAAAALQRYLIFAILSVVPDRQRTLRELEVGRTLVKEGDRWLIKHGPDDYKTGKQYGERPPLLIAPFIYPELEAFISTWRQELRNTGHSMLFVMPETGRPMTAQALYSTFKWAAHRLTGKATHPHLVRDMIVTHLRTLGTSEAEMEALALYMGHSLSMQRNTYDRRTQAQKVTPAINLLQRLAGQGS